MKCWNPILTELNREVVSTRNSLQNSNTKANAARLEFKRTYLQLLVSLYRDIKTFSRFADVEQYAERLKLPIFSDPHWADFVPEETKAKFLRRQGKLYATARTFRQVFDRALRPERGTRRKAMLHAKLEIEYGHAMRGWEGEKGMGIEDGHGPFALAQIEAAKKYLDNWPKGKPLPMPKYWLCLLPAKDRMDIDTTPNKRVVYIPPVPDNPMPTYAQRGRPKGAKDNAPRTRRKLTTQEREQYKTKRKALAEYRQLAATHRAQELYAKKETL